MIARPDPVKDGPVEQLTEVPDKIFHRCVTDATTLGFLRAEIVPPGDIDPALRL